MSLFWILCFGICHSALFAQDPVPDDLEITIDLSANTVPLPKIFKPNIDLSGTGSPRSEGWPRNLATSQAIDAWQKDIGFEGIYRLQFNLWEMNEKLEASYETVIKKISDAGGVVLLDIYGTPAGLGKVLDRRSPPFDLKAFKELLKKYIRLFSCEKKYTVWYELWSAPDLDEFFLGGKDDYLNMYRALSEAVKELEIETKINIPAGGPATSWWFQGINTNTILSAERSLIYDLIRYCRRNNLTLDFISWHAYSTDPKIEKESTGYDKTAVALVRDWLTYFNFDRDTPLVVDEWNYDSGANFLPARKERSNIAASYIPARLENMRDAGIDYQVFFSLEDFSGKETPVRNTGASGKAIYNTFQMLAKLGSQMFVLPKLNDDYAGVIASRSAGTVTVLLYNYIDPYIGRSYISRQVAALNDAERKMLLGMIKQDKLDDLIAASGSQEEINRLRRCTHRLKNMLKKSRELNFQAAALKEKNRNLKIIFKGLKNDYAYKRYSVDASCTLDCGLVACEEKEIRATEAYEESVSLRPYSVALITLEPIEAAVPEAKSDA